MINDAASVKHVLKLFYKAKNQNWLARKLNLASISIRWLLLLMPFYNLIYTMSSIKIFFLSEIIYLTKSHTRLTRMLKRHVMDCANRENLLVTKSRILDELLTIACLPFRSDYFTIFILTHDSTKGRNQIVISLFRLFIFFAESFMKRTWEKFKNKSTRAWSENL